MNIREEFEFTSDYEKEIQGYTDNNKIATKIISGYLLRDRKVELEDIEVIENDLRKRLKEFIKDDFVLKCSNENLNFELFFHVAGQSALSLIIK